MRAREHTRANAIRRKAGREGQACAYSARRFVSSRARNLLGSIQREPTFPLSKTLRPHHPDADSVLAPGCCEFFELGGVRGREETADGRGKFLVLG